MKLQASNSSFQPAPEGTTLAVLVDIVDLGMQPDKYNEGEMVHQVRLTFQTEDKTDEGKPFIVSTFPYKASLNSKANLYKVISTLLGRKLAKEDFDEEGNVDLDELLIGKNVMITIEHKQSADGTKTYANITSIGPVPKSIKTRLEPEGYVRVQDRESVSVEGDSEGKANSATAGKDGDIPF